MSTPDVFSLPQNKEKGELRDGESDSRVRIRTLMRCIGSVVIDTLFFVQQEVGWGAE